MPDQVLDWREELGVWHTFGVEAHHPPAPRRRVRGSPDSDGLSAAGSSVISAAIADAGLFHAREQTAPRSTPTARSQESRGAAVANDRHIERLIRVVQRAQRGEATAQDVADTIQRQAPDLASVAQRLLIPKTAGDFYAMLAVLLAILLYVLAQGDTGMSGHDTETVTQEVVEQVMNKKPPMPVAPTAEPPRTKRPPPPPRKRHAQAKKKRKR